ncbi:alpha/beta fold hydrolase [Streptomyces sp. NPDC056632]|uniref:alpha/beta fold hydrolase n=1 Tax=Streptomyces sp. NPDC056632 TaxID=3345884 RepID=UPI00367786DC
MSDEPESQGPRICQGPDDPRLLDIDSDFRELLGDLGRIFSDGSRMLRRRTLHHPSVSAAGVLTIDEGIRIPPHGLLRPGARFEVLARFSNALPSDDAAPSLRGVTLRWFEGTTPDTGNTTATSGPGRTPLWDLTLNTGECFHASTAHQFRVMDRPGPERDALLKHSPALRHNVWDGHREAVSYAEYDYYSQVPRYFTAADGTHWAARFRLVPDSGPADAGRFDPAGLWLPPQPPGELPRAAGDERSPALLKEDLRARLSNGEVRGVLQIQLRPLTGDPASDALILDASLPWPHQAAPWQDLARLRLTDAVDDAEVERLRFDPALAPPSLGIALTASPHSTASVNHLRALVYRLASAARLREEPPAALAALSAARGKAVPAVSKVTAEGRKAPRTVCIIGAGPAGLTAARELERRGHRAVVLEAASGVAGKCASVEIDGHVFDLGGHLCTTAYRHVADLAVELGVETEDTTPHLVHDMSTGLSRPQSDDLFHSETFRRYTELRAASFPDIAEPGLAHSARALAAPVGEWLAEHRLDPLAASLGTGYTAAGYGHLDSPLPALFLAKYAELTGLLSSTPQLLGHARSFTPAQGFGEVWERVAAQLSDVRTGIRVEYVERHADGVLIHTDQGPVHADELVIAVPLDTILPVLDATPEERELGARVEYIDYSTQVVTATGLPRSAFYLLEEHTRTSTPGACVSFHHRHEGSDVYACYSYGGDGLTLPDLERRLAQDIARLGGRMTAVHEQRRWNFMPHFGQSAILDGAYDRFEALQAVNRTYYLGGLPSFELVECVVAHARYTIGSFFPALRGRRDTTPHPDRHTITPSGPRPEQRPAVSSEDIVAFLSKRLAHELGIPMEEIHPDHPLDSYGLTSLSAAVLQGELSDWLGYRVPHHLLLASPTLSVVASELAAPAGLSTTAGPTTAPSPHLVKASPGRSSLLVPLSPAQPLFLCGGIAGTVHHLKPLARAIGSGQPCYGLHPPGLDGEEAPVRRIEDLAERYAEEIRQTQPHGPYSLAGHSFGGLVAYETALQLADEGHQVSRVILLDTHVPLPNQQPPAPDEAASIAEMCRMNQLLFADGGEAPWIDPELPLTTQRNQLARVLGATGTLPPEEHVVHLLEVYQANLEAAALYWIRGSDLPVSLIRATRGFPQVMTPGRAIENTGGADNGWSRVGLTDLTVLPVDADHFTVLSDRHRESVARLIRLALHGTDSGPYGPGVLESATPAIAPEGSHR